MAAFLLAKPRGFALNTQHGNLALRQDGAGAANIGSF